MDADFPQVSATANYAETALQIMAICVLSRTNQRHVLAHPCRNAIIKAASVPIDAN